MTIDDRPDWGPNTIAVRTGQQRSSEAEQSEPIFATSSFTFADAAEAAARFAGQPGNLYSRFTNPTVRTFAQRLAAMERGETCVATASGMAAIVAMCLGLLRNGDHIVASRSLFGTSVQWLQQWLPRYGITTTFVSLTDLPSWERAINANTRLLFCETPSNPLTELVDIAALADLAHSRNAWLAVDNCFCTPALQQPLALGADLVIHSATKYLDGQGRCLGGAIVGNQELVGDRIYSFLRTAGPSMSPFNAWVFLKGLETLKLRMQAHCANAKTLADWLTQQPNVMRVHYPGLANHPQHALALRQQSGFGGIVSLALHGGQRAAWRLIDRTNLISITANLGDTKTTITHPATTTHSRLSPDERHQAGIVDGLVRLSVGLEDIADIQTDLSRGLAS